MTWTGLIEDRTGSRITDRGARISADAPAESVNARRLERQLRPDRLDRRRNTGPMGAWAMNTVPELHMTRPVP